MPPFAELADAETDVAVLTYAETLETAVAKFGATTVGVPEIKPVAVSNDTPLGSVPHKE